MTGRAIRTCVPVTTFARRCPLTACGEAAGRRAGPLGHADADDPPGVAAADPQRAERGEEPVEVGGAFEGQGGSDLPGPGVQPVDVAGGVAGPGGVTGAGDLVQVFVGPVLDWGDLGRHRVERPGRGAAWRVTGAGEPEGAVDEGVGRAGDAAYVDGWAVKAG